jgi:hypothetical protein
MDTPHPILIKEAFQFNNERHNTYNLRNRDTDLAPPMPKKEFGKRCFSYNGALHWNNLPHEAKIAGSLRSFKSSSFKSFVFLVNS